MRRLKYTFWQDGDFFIGYLNDYPDYETQGYSKEELLENLKDLLSDIESGEVPFIRKVEEMLVAP
ncbi:MAG: type II toxin-antitoxin system HicB family antitoxin [Acidobacteriota bacterium]|nr:type II toxin-antitoxin system HicB family antitoxin [Acidobacteriota bacterium]